MGVNARLSAFLVNALRSPFFFSVCVDALCFDPVLHVSGLHFNWVSGDGVQLFCLLCVVFLYFHFFSLSSFLLCILIVLIVFGSGGNILFFTLLFSLVFFSHFIVFHFVFPLLPFCFLALFKFRLLRKV